MKIDVLTFAIIIFSLGVCVSAMDLENTFGFADESLQPVLQRIQDGP